MDPTMELITYSFVLYLQHGRHYVKCKPSIQVVLLNSGGPVVWKPDSAIHLILFFSKSDFSSEMLNFNMVLPVTELVYSSFEWFATTQPKMPDSNNCFWHLSAVANFTPRHGFCSIFGKILHFVFIQFTWDIGVLRIRIWRVLLNWRPHMNVEINYWCSSISNWGDRKSLEIAVKSLKKSLFGR